MRIIVQRVRQAAVDVAGTRIASIGCGLLCLVGFGARDTLTMPSTPVWQGMQDKLLHLRIFPEENAPDKMQRSVLDSGGDLLFVPQFTLYADCRKGRRPAFQEAAAPEVAQKLFRRWIMDIDERCNNRLGYGEFGACMDVHLCNWGPVTITLDSEELYPHSSVHIE